MTSAFVIITQMIQFSPILIVPVICRDFLGGLGLYSVWMRPGPSQRFHAAETHWTESLTLFTHLFSCWQMAAEMVDECKVPLETVTKIQFFKFPFYINLMENKMISSYYKGFPFLDFPGCMPANWTTNLYFCFSWSKKRPGGDRCCYWRTNYMIHWGERWLGCVM